MDNLAEEALTAIRNDEREGDRERSFRRDEENYQDTESETVHGSMAKVLESAERLKELVEEQEPHIIQAAADIANLVRHTSTKTPIEEDDYSDADFAQDEIIANMTRDAKQELT